MTKASAPAVSTHSSASINELAQELLGTLVSIFRMCGLSGNDLLEAAQRAIGETDTRSTTDVPVYLGGMQRECMEVMCAWRRDKNFLGPDALPASLPFAGGDRSFEALCARANVETDPSELLKTLMDFGAIRQLEDGRFHAETPTFLLGEQKNSRKLALDGVIRQLAGFSRTVEFNTRQALTGKRPRFERSCTVVVPAELLPVFERLVRERGQTFVDVLDEWLERHRGEESISQTYIEIGAGAYFLDLGIIKKQ